MIYLYLASPYVTWLFFLAIMNLIRAKKAGTISHVALYLGYPLLAVGYVLDVFVNVCVLSPLTLSLPRELTTTAHLKRLMLDAGWRDNVAFWICRNLLDTFDPSGRHC